MYPGLIFNVILNVFPVAASLPLLPVDSAWEVVESVSVVPRPVTPILQREAGMLGVEKVPLAVKVELVDEMPRFQFWLVFILMVLKLVITDSLSYSAGVSKSILYAVLVMVICITACMLTVEVKFPLL